MNSEDLGKAAKVICSQVETLIIGAGGMEEQRRKRVEEIDAHLNFAQGKSSPANIEILRVNE